jgi:type IV fimbrial biogenesis protein FimT
MVLRMHIPHAPKTRSGFTLVEMLVTVCIAGVLAAVVVPFASSIGTSMKLSSYANGFLSNLYLARSEAIMRNAPVAMCKSADGAACSADGGWEQGWIVFHDPSGNGAREADELLVQRVEALPPGFRLRGNLNVARYVSFAPSGATRTATGAFQAGTLTVCRASLDSAEARQIVINAVGRPRVQKVTLASCE